VSREVVEVRQHRARLGFDDRLRDVGAGERLDRLSRLPERQGDKFRAAVDFFAVRRLAGLRAVVFFAAVFRAVRLFAGGTVTTFR